MQRMGMAIRIRPERLEEYKRLHAAPWPDMDAALQAAGIRNYSIWLEESQMLLFGYWEYVGQDFDADMAALGALPVTRAWLALTDPCQAPMTPGAQGWSFLPRVYQLGGGDA